MSKVVEKVILVIAPQFPSINQPWIDTYLEQLLRHGLEPLIYTCNDSPGPYSPKVDLLGLRTRIIFRSLEEKAVLIGLVRALFGGGLQLLFRLWWDVRKRGLRGRTAILGMFTGCYLNHSITQRVSLIHSHDEILAYRFLFLALARGVPLVMTFHGLPPAGVGQLATDKRATLYRSVSRVIVNTEFAKRQVCSLGCPAEKVTVLPQGLPIDEFPFVPRELKEEDKKILLLTVGRYHRDKGQAYALIALRRLINAGLQAHWTFVGVGPDLARLKRLTSKLGVTDYVKFLVALPPSELCEQYHQASIFVLPSVVSPGGHVETQGVVLQEAQASGCIVVASQVGGIPECLHENEDAFLVKHKSSRALMNALTLLVAQRERWPELSCSSRKNVEAHYSADVIGRQMADILNKEMKS